jgi:hypothetical protein
LKVDGQIVQRHKHTVRDMVTTRERQRQTEREKRDRGGRRRRVEWSRGDESRVFD